MVPMSRQRRRCRCTWALSVHHQEVWRKKSYTNAMRAFCAARFWMPATVPVMATMNWQTHIPTAPNISKGRLPQASTRYNPGNVEATLTHDVMSVMTKGFWMPELVKKLVP